ncbi:hypothetical protein [Kibdelosporangium aridum]|uniref:Uncharacterized protein n=1 Tax=Kibdelosporangium aridum TaxID=2030 RepID=A0A1Y5Y1L0_KIBAR|nr:hypothetical protein [Kibdelosporangium aridum]SMD22988.1 hypothetical protein SAMN05661093_07769 [Kibdelosporangium aridum]
MTSLLPISRPETTVRSHLLDCIQANLAVLADRWHGPDTHLALGAALRFRPRTTEDGLPTVEPEMVPQVTEACALTGMTVDARARFTTPGQLRDLAERNTSLYVVADAFEMPWLPYFGQRHMDHSFLVEPVGEKAIVVDAYHNQTQWGSASPGTWELQWDELPHRGRVMALSPRDVETPHPVVQVEPPARYLAAYDDYPDRQRSLDRLCVETWLLARSRALHAAFLAAHGTRVPDEHLRRWELLAGQAFVAMRRVQRGHAEPPGLLSTLAALLAADPEMFRKDT